MGRVTNRELISSIVRTKETISSYVFQGKKTQYYNKTGTGFAQLDDQDTVAKAIVTDTSKTFYIKFNQKNEVFDPNNKSYLEVSFKYACQIGLKDNCFKFILVSEDTFNYYISYLKNKKLTYLHKVNQSI